MKLAVERAGIAERMASQVAHPRACTNDPHATGLGAFPKSLTASSWLDHPLGVAHLQASSAWLIYLEKRKVGVVPLADATGRSSMEKEVLKAKMNRETDVNQQTTVIGNL